MNVQDLGGSSACKIGRHGFKVSKTQTLNPKLGSKFLRQVGVCLYRVGPSARPTPKPLNLKLQT